MMGNHSPSFLQSPISMTDPAPFTRTERAMSKPVTKQSIPIGSRAASSQPDPSDPAWTVWQWHLNASNIGNGRGTTPAQLAQHAQNERALRGPRKPSLTA